MRSAICSMSFTPRAISMRRLLANRLMSERHFGVFRLLKKQRGAAVLHGAIGELGDFKIGIYLNRDSLQFSLLFQERV